MNTLNQKCLCEILSYLSPFLIKGSSLINLRSIGESGTRVSQSLLCSLWKAWKSCTTDKFYPVPNTDPWFSPFLVLLWLKKYICVYFSPYPVLCMPSVLAVLKYSWKHQPKPGFLFEDSQLTWSKLLGIGKRIFSTLGNVYHSEKPSRNTCVFTL